MINFGVLGERARTAAGSVDAEQRGQQDAGLRRAEQPARDGAGGQEVDPAAVAVDGRYRPGGHPGRGDDDDAGGAEFGDRGADHRVGVSGAGRLEDDAARAGVDEGPERGRVGVGVAGHDVDPDIGRIERVEGEGRWAAGHR